MKKLLSLLLLITLVFSFAACSDDDDPASNNENEKDAWIGTWLSAGDNVAPILVSVFSYDSVRVTLNEDLTVSLESHVKDGAWTTSSGTYTVTETEGSDIHTIYLNYTTFEQGGIVQIIEGEPDQLKLEAVQTTPDIGAVPRTPETGFGSDATLGDLNIQNYVRID